MIKTKAEAEKNKYGAWAGQPNGTPYDPTKCAAEIPGAGNWPIFKQCTRKPGHGPDNAFCKQHAEKLKPRTVADALDGPPAPNDGEPVDDLPAVVGPLSITPGEFEHRARVLLRDEQEGIAPDTTKIAFYADAVRLARECQVFRLAAYRRGTRL